eukprot:gene8006-12471_t
MTTTPGQIGLVNLGNSHLNSILQCLSTIPQLQKYFSSKNWKDEINEKNILGSGGNIVKEFGNFMEEVLNPTGSTYNPIALKKEIGKIAPHLSGYQTMDSHEFLCFLVDIIHEDLNRILKKPTYSLDTEEEGDDEKLATSFWKKFLSRNDSIIADHFYGQTKTVIECPNCSRKRIVFDPLFTFDLKIPQSDRDAVDVYDGFYEYTNPEILSDEDLWYCSKCKEHVNAKVTKTIWKTPDVLILRFKRVIYSQNKKKELDTLVNFPLKDLDISKFVDTKIDHTYNLVATSNFRSGHYDAIVKVGDKWLHLDDTKCVSIDENSIVDKSSYLLFYVKKE